MKGSLRNWGNLVTKLEQETTLLLLLPHCSYFSSSPTKHRTCISTLYIRFMTSCQQADCIIWKYIFFLYWSLGLIFAICSQWCNPSKPLHFLLIVIRLCCLESRCGSVCVCVHRFDLSYRICMPPLSFTPIILVFKFQNVVVVFL